MNATTGLGRNALIGEPVDLPRDARSILKFRAEVSAEIERLTADAERQGCWDTTQDILFDLKSPAFWAYWIHKTHQPITRAMLGSSIERDLARFRAAQFHVLPAGVRIYESWTLSAVGDLMCTRGLESSRDQLYADVEELVFGADISYANLESTLTTTQVGSIELSTEASPMINVTLNQYRALVAHKDRKFHIVQLANNHILDCGLEGIETTLKQLRADGIEQVGVNENAQSVLEPRITEHRGLKIGWVAHTFSVNFKPFPPNEPWRVNLTSFHVVRQPDTSILEEQIRRCRQSGCDLVFVTLHWGLEFEFFPHPHQRMWAHRFAEIGADLVLGHHPHVIQPVEIYHTRHGRAVPIVYSLGNLTPVFSHPATALSLVARVRLVRVGAGKNTEVRIANLDLTPVALIVASQAQGRTLRLCRLAGLQTASCDAHMRSYICDMGGYADLVIGKGWRVS